MASPQNPMGPPPPESTETLEEKTLEQSSNQATSQMNGGGDGSQKPLKTKKRRSHRKHRRGRKKRHRGESGQGAVKRHVPLKLSSRQMSKKLNIDVHLNIYDLHNMNDYLYCMGLGLFHTGVHIQSVAHRRATQEKSFLNSKRISKTNPPLKVPEESVSETTHLKAAIHGTPSRDSSSQYSATLKRHESPPSISESPLSNPSNASRYSETNTPTGSAIGGGIGGGGGGSGSGGSGNESPPMVSLDATGTAMGNGYGSLESTPPRTSTSMNGPSSSERAFLPIVNLEYAYGGNPFTTATGMFSNPPCIAPGDAQLRCSLFVGQTQLTLRELNRILDSFRSAYLARDYDVLTKNCNHFSNDLISTLIPRSSIPPWVNRLASIGKCCECCLPNQVRYPLNYLDPGLFLSSQPAMESHIEIKKDSHVPASVHRTDEAREKAREERRLLSNDAMNAPISPGQDDMKSQSPIGASSHEPSTSSTSTISMRRGHRRMPTGEMNRMVENQRLGRVNSLKSSGVAIPWIGDDGNPRRHYRGRKRRRSKTFKVGPGSSSGDISDNESSFSTSDGDGSLNAGQIVDDLHENTEYQSLTLGHQARDSLDASKTDLGAVLDDETEEADPSQSLESSTTIDV